MANVHKDYDGREVNVSHLGFKGRAWVEYAGWDDWYLIFVDGRWDNGNYVKGYLCREQAHTIKDYLV